MTDKTDTAGKGTGSPTEQAPQKRPHATLDLKAMEVKDQAAPKPAAPAARDTEAQKASAEARGTAEAAKPAAASPGEKPAEPAAAKSGEKAKAAASQSVANPPTRSGFGRVVASLAAGLAGGLIVLFGGDRLAATLGVPVPGLPPSETSAALGERLAALEQAVSSASSERGPSEQLARAETRIAALEDQAKRLADIEAAQSRLTDEAKALTGRIEERAGGSAALDRIGRLEERLATLAAAAETDSDKGRIQGLAAVTGKLADLETALTNQISALRKSVPQEVEARVAPVAETSEAAKTGAQRIDRDMVILKTEAARLTQRLDTLKAESDRAAAALNAIEEQQGALTGHVEAAVKSAAKPADIASAVSPLASKVTALEKSLESVVKSEEDRKVNAERVVVSLELANLKRALDQGRGYEAELQAVKEASGGRLDLSGLERFKATGVPSLAALGKSFAPIATAIIDADAEPADGSVMDRLLAGAKSVVRVRKVSHTPGDTSTEAIVARIERALAEGRLADVIAETGNLSDKARAPANDWLGKVEALAATDKALTAVESELKSSISGIADDAKTDADKPAPAAPAQN